MGLKTCQLYYTSASEAQAYLKLKKQSCLHRHPKPIQGKQVSSNTCNL